jgi:rod shape-determining protein MreC
MDFRKILLVLFVVALPLISINIQRNPGESPWYMRPFIFAAGATQQAASQVVFTIRNTVRTYINLIGTKRENRELKEKLAQMETQMAQFEEVRNENARLNKILDFKSKEGLLLVAARVIGYDLSSQYATFKINRGTDDGVAVGQAVVTPEGVAGTILSVEKSRSQVLVLTDRYSVIDAIVQRSRARGIVEGRTQTTAQLKYLQRTDDVQTGDLVVTSGLDPSLPPGFPIAKVVAVEKKPHGITQIVELEPMLDASQLEEVLVVIKVLGASDADKKVGVTALPSTTIAKAFSRLRGH